MLKLKKLTFSGIGPFVDEQTIDFSALSGLIQIDAQNNNTGGGSSGSGKSTIFQAFSWLIGTSNKPTTTLQSRLTKNHISVEGEFDWDGRFVTIKRNRKLSVVIDGVETTGSSKLTEEKLDEIISMPRNIFHSIFHRRQKQQGFFLQMTPAKMNEFLTDALGHRAIRSKIDLTDTKAKDISSAKDKAQSDLQALQAAIEAIMTSLNNLGEEPTTDATELHLMELKACYDYHNEQVLIVQNHNKKEKDYLDSQRPKIIIVPFDKTILDGIENEYREFQSQVNDLTIKENNRQSDVRTSISNLKNGVAAQISALTLENNKKQSDLKNELTKLNYSVQNGKTAKDKAVQIAQQIKTLRSGICHTCTQSWISENAKNEETKLLTSLGILRQDIETGQVAEAQINVSHSVQNELNVQNEIQIKDLKDSLETNLFVLNKELLPRIPEELTILEEKLVQLNTLKAQEQEKERLYNSTKNAENEHLMSVFYAEQKALAEKHQKSLVMINNNIEELRNKYVAESNSLKTHKILLENYVKNKNSLKEQSESMNQKMVHMNQKLVQLKEDLEVAEETKRCLKSYLSCSFDDALEDISENATKIIRVVPTMANATIRLIGTKETAAGAIKEQINAVIDNNGEIGIPIDSLSGGEDSVVDLGVDFAVSEFIQEKTNIGIDVLFLDEILEGLDTIGKEQIIEMLRTLSNNRKILIVEHDSIVKELINDKITVIRDGETSYIK